VSFVGGPRRGEPGALPVGEVLFAGAQDVPDPVQRIVLAAAVAVDLLLHPPANIVDDLGGQLDHMEGVEDGAGILELVVDRVLVPVERVQRRDLHASPERRSAVV
jgi:hypothetical protein